MYKSLGGASGRLAPFNRAIHQALTGIHSLGGTQQKMTSKPCPLPAMDSHARAHTHSRKHRHTNSGQQRRSPHIQHAPDNPLPSSRCSNTPSPSI